VVRPEIAMIVLAAAIGGNEGAVRALPAQVAPLQQQEAPKPPLSGSSAPAPSQDAPVATPPATSRLVLKDGTPVQLKFARAVVSSQVIAGEKVDLQVATEVRVGDRIVIPKDSLAQAMVTMAQARRGMARGGNLQMKIETVRLATGEMAPLRMIQDVKGGGHTAAMVGGMIATGLVLLPAAPLLLMVPGKDAVVPKGTEITAYVDGDVSLDPAKLPSAPAASQPAPKEAVPQHRNGSK